MQINKRPIYININAISVIKIILIFILFYVLFLIKDILALLFIALILASAIDPIVDWLQVRKIPRGLGVLFIYFILLLSIVSVVTLIIPPIVEQSTELSDNLPAITNKLSEIFSTVRDFFVDFGFLGDTGDNFANLSNNLPQAAGGVFSTVKDMVIGVFSFFIVLVITF
jgi:predicted PurR-regulated permease PerM